ncbi:hypothetical protein TWF718_006784 [Orbilia javanica]|uniref:Uncharacterized protein n=1 Tax=Orbilia javanica TaxID=47235 RepID=A0AAN8RCP5_9PEZI
MKSDEELEVLVNQLALDSTIGLDDWPDVLQFMLKRLEWIAYNSFPLPKPPPLLGPKPPVSISRESTVLIQSSEEEHTPNSSETAGETRESSSTPTAAPTVDVEATQTQQADPTVQASPQPQEPSSIPSTQTTSIPATQFPSEAINSNSTEKFLPPTLLSSLNSLVTLLGKTFPRAPPHTIQRFAELILKPNKHYRSLAKFLRACHRVVSVTSGSDRFPLPTSHDGQPSSNAIPIGSGLANDHDDGATGATLTPIPWASAREYVANNGVDAAGSPVSDEGVAALVTDEGGNGISQGELLRKEQEADVVITEGTSEDGPAVGGPPELDAADVGPQPEGTVFGEAPKDEGGDEDKDGDKMDVDEKVEEKGE